MRPAFFLSALMLGAAAMPVAAQDGMSSAIGEVLVTSSRNNARFAQADRPVVGVRRQADSVVLQVSFSSDSRDEAVRKREIHAMLLAALERSAAADVEVVSGNFELVAVTKDNYQDLPLRSAGRVDTSELLVMLKVKLTGSTSAAEVKLNAFVKSIPSTGRGAIEKARGITLTIINPDQYRDAIVKQVADHARRYAAMFGPDYAVQVTGIDGQVAWSQVSMTDVFLYVPYRYVIVPK